MTRAYGYGLLVRAHGAVQDPRSWPLWHDMRSSGMALVSTTIGCIVEALVPDGDLQAALSCEASMRLVVRVARRKQTVTTNRPPNCGSWLCR